MKFLKFDCKYIYINNKNKNLLRFSSSKLYEQIETKKETNLENEKIFSKLYVNSSLRQKIAKIVQPELSLNKYLDDNYLNSLKENLNLRKHESNTNGLTNEIDFNKIKEKVKELIKLKDKIKKSKDEESYNCIKEDRIKLESLEIELIPILLRLPNDYDKKDVPIESFHDKIIKEKSPKPVDFKILDCKKISYTNNYRKSSIIGPHCEYLMGKGSEIYLALNKFFKNYIKQTYKETNDREKRHLHFVDGLDFMKSALVEAGNDYENFNFKDDSLIINLEKNIYNQQIHLAGNCSLTSVMSLLIKKEIKKKYLPARFVQFGANYSQDFKQINSVCFYTVVENNYEISNEEFSQTEKLLWNIYSQLNIPIRLRKVNLKKLKFNEYKRIELDVWFPYSREWKKIANFSHYSDYLLKRINCKNYHSLGGYIVDFNLLLDSILENNQTENGKIIIPKCLEQFY